jgi:hypothetical protein
MADDLRGGEQVVKAIRAELAKHPRYWIRIANQPMERSATAMFVADVERALDAVLARSSTGETAAPEQK